MRKKRSSTNTRTRFTAGTQRTQRGILVALLCLPACVFAQTTLTLEQLEKMALENHPAVAQAQAMVRAAEGRTLQAGLYPNPVLGGTGDENAPGPVIRGGEFGGFFEQRIVTAGKLKLDRQVARHGQQQTAHQAEAQRQRVLNAVRMLFYEALGADRVVGVRGELAKLAARAVATSRELANVGQADKPDVLASEIEAQRAELGLTMAKNAQQRAWRQLAAAAGKPEMEMTPLAGELEAAPKLELEAEMRTLLEKSPEVGIAQAMIRQEESGLRRAQVEKIPDIQVRGGVRYNRELLELGGTPVGVEGFFDVGVRIPLFDRNQGAVAAARAELDRARREEQRVKLSLRSRLAAAWQQYQDDQSTALLYREQLIPRARQSHEMYAASFKQMAAAYPQVLISQRSLFQMEEEYVHALVGVWSSAVEIQGLLLGAGGEMARLRRPERGKATEEE